MNPEIKELLEISRFYGRNSRYVIAGGGNTSYKNEDTIWIKASGQQLSDLTEDGLVALTRENLRKISMKEYSENPVKREDQVKNDLLACLLDPNKHRRPSVETSLHEIIQYKFVVHLHPTIVNGLLCSNQAEKLTLQLFGNKVLFVKYTDPGYTLFKKLDKEISSYRARFHEDPKIIFLENHGVFVSSDKTDDIRKIYDYIISTIETHLKPFPEITALPPDPLLYKVLPAIRMIFSDVIPVTVRHRNNTLIARYYADRKEFDKISRPLIPDMVVYCKPAYLYIEQASSAEELLDSLKTGIDSFRDRNGYMPKVIMIRDHGLLAVDDSYSSAEAVLDVYEDLIRISYLSSQCGGTRSLTPDEVSFIDKWEVENYRRKVAKAGSAENRLFNKVAIVTGGAQGFGAGIAESLFRLNVNVVVADLNEETGTLFTNSLDSKKSTNKAIFVRTDVADPISVRALVETAVGEFGGIDIMISNAGVLKAGSLEEIEPDVFSKTTDINYNGYYHCVKYASEVMKLQNASKPDYYSDIIQINSKSGLKGSNRNFAYAGAKFGGIGLTQSFALELAPFRIKVNSICPGNFYEGPLWSDPKNGLFVQYLKSGKVPGAKTIDDVRKFYENQVPMRRGCRMEDVMKALLYIIDQEYETGQAVPVTGGQVMLG